MCNSPPYPQAASERPPLSTALDIGLKKIQIAIPKASKAKVLHAVGVPDMAGGCSGSSVFLKRGGMKDLGVDHDSMPTPCALGNR